MVTVDPLTVATSVSELAKLTVRPELAEADRLTDETEVSSDDDGTDVKLVVYSSNRRRLG